RPFALRLCCGLSWFSGLSLAYPQATGVFTFDGGILCSFSLDVSVSKSSSPTTSASRSRRSRATGSGSASRRRRTCGSTARRCTVGSRSSRSPSWWPRPGSDGTVSDGAAGPRATHAFPQRRCAMNWDQVQGQWKQLTGKLRSKWGKLTNDDWKFVGGKKDQLVGKLQERYGCKNNQAERA